MSAAVASREVREKLAERVKEADKMLKEATKLIKPALLDFRLKPDWESAAPLLDKSALIYKQAGKLDQALDTYERAAQAQEKLKSPWHAAKHYETCAELCKNANRMEDALKYFKMAGEAFIESGKITSGADCLARGAKALSESHPKEAMQLYYEAIDLYESEDKEINASDLYRQAIQMLVKQKKWHDVVEMQMRFGAACDKSGARNSQMKAYLGAVMTWLYAGEAEYAWQTFQDALVVDAFMSSDEAFVADAVFKAYRTGSAEEVRQVIQAKSLLLKHLDNSVARLALKLPTGDVKAMSRQLQGVMSGYDDDDDDGQGHRGDGDEEEEEEEEIL